MNQNQKYVLIGVIVVLFFQLIFFIPIKYEYSAMRETSITLYDHRGLFSNWLPQMTIDIPKFILYWGIIFIFGGMAFYIAKDDKEKKKK